MPGSDQLDSGAQAAGYLYTERYYLVWPKSLLTQFENLHFVLVLIIIGAYLNWLRMNMSFMS